jgi:archaeal type IV pilus assembly protein PilA
MKKLWKMRKDSKAVSPVIATILMVAITVVLAAVLYVMVMGFGGGNTQNTPTATMTYQKTTTVAPQTLSTYTFTVAGVTRNDVKLSDLTILVTPSVAALPNTQPAGNPAIGPGTTGNLVAGDQFIVSGCTPGIAYTITIGYAPSGGAVYQNTWTAS